MKTITLEQLIEEGSEIKKQISYINVPAGVIRTYRAYQLSDNQKYEIEVDANTGKIIKNEKGFTSCVFKSGLAISKCASFGSYYMDSLWSDF